MSRYPEKPFAKDFKEAAFPRGVVQNHCPLTSHRPLTTDHSDTYHRPPTTYLKITDPTTDLKNRRPPTNGCEKTDHRPEQQPTTDQIKVVKPPTTDHIANMLYLLRDFSAIAIL